MVGMVYILALCPNSWLFVVIKAPQTVRDSSTPLKANILVHNTTLHFQLFEAFEKAMGIPIA